MATPAVAPIILNDILLILGSDNYEAHVSRAELVPTTPKAMWKGMTPTAVKNLVGTPTWVLNIEGAQDHATALSLTQYLQANVGQTVTSKLVPKKGATTAPTYTQPIVIEPGSIGGALDAVATFSVGLAVDGQPVRSVA